MIPWCGRNQPSPWLKNGNALFANKKPYSGTTAIGLSSLPMLQAKQNCFLRRNAHRETVTCPMLITPRVWDSYHNWFDFPTPVEGSQFRVEWTSRLHKTRGDRSSAWPESSSFDWCAEKRCQFRCKWVTMFQFMSPEVQLRDITETHFVVAFGRV